MAKGYLILGQEKYYTETFQKNRGRYSGYGERYGEVYDGRFSYGYGSCYGESFGGTTKLGYVPIGDIAYRIQNKALDGYGCSYGKSYSKWGLFLFPKKDSIGYGKYYGKFYGSSGNSIPLPYAITLLCGITSLDATPIDITHWGLGGSLKSDISWINHAPIILNRTGSLHQTWLGFGLKY